MQQKQKNLATSYLAPILYTQSKRCRNLNVRQVLQQRPYKEVFFLASYSANILLLKLSKALGFERRGFLKEI
jgi:hypothetical protein